MAAADVDEAMALTRSLGIGLPAFALFVQTFVLTAALLNRPAFALFVLTTPFAVTGLLLSHRAKSPVGVRVSKVSVGLLVVFLVVPFVVYFLGGLLYFMNELFGELWTR